MFKKHKFISFLIIFARMGTSTNYIELKRGLSLYIKQYYKPTTVTANTYSWGDRIRTIIGKNYPCILGLTSHPRYGEHWVVVTGYNFTSHNSGTYTVNDGWGNVGININSSYKDGGVDYNIPITVDTRISVVPTFRTPSPFISLFINTPLSNTFFLDTLFQM